MINIHLYDFILLIGVLVFLFLLELLYFKIADKYNIIDRPNHRSSHSAVTLRGGGIIFSIALLLSPVVVGWHYTYFLVGLLLISTISFIDDIETIGYTVRIFFHITAVGFLFYQLNVYNLAYWLIVLTYLFVIGVVNAVNFMDGINGITGGYGLVVLTTLYYINAFVTDFTSSHLLLIAIASVLVFNYFNFRVKAKCFAGDVGSIGLSFIIAFFLLQLILKTHDLNYVLLLLIYGLDTVTTMLFRLIRKEKITEAHRSHFYQYLVNEKKIPHLSVAFGYAIIQVIINVLFLNYLPKSGYWLIFSVIITGIIFINIRFQVEGKRHLLKPIGKH